MNLYRENYSDPKRNAQDNLIGRSHYVDDNTLRFHGSRILSAGVAAEGLLFWLIESVALDPDGRKRGFRFVIFDVFGSVIERANLDESFKSKDAARKAMERALSALNPKALTLAALAREQANSVREFDALHARVCELFPEEK